MKVTENIDIDITGNVAIIKIGPRYDISEENKIAEFGDSEEVKNLKQIIVDCEGWESFSSMSFELIGLYLQLANPIPTSLIFSGANSHIKESLELVAEVFESEEPIFVDTIEEALELNHSK